MKVHSVTSALTLLIQNHQFGYVAVMVPTVTIAKEREEDLYVYIIVM